MNDCGTIGDTLSGVNDMPSAGEYADGLARLNDNGQLFAVLRDAASEAARCAPQMYADEVALIATVAVTVELLLVGVLLWWAWRQDRLTGKWRRRLMAALPIAVLFGLVRLALAPSVVGAVWLAGVVVAWTFVARIPVTDPDPVEAGEQ